MSSFDLVERLLTPNKWKVLACLSDLSPARPGLSELFDNKKEAEAAIHQCWPDVAPGPHFDLTGPGYRIATAVNRYSLYMASADNDETILFGAD